MQLCMTFHHANVAPTKISNKIILFCQKMLQIYPSIAANQTVFREMNSRDPGPFFPGNGKAQTPKFPGNSRPGNSRERTLIGGITLKMPRAPNVSNIYWANPKFPPDRRFLALPQIFPTQYT